MSDQTIYNILVLLFGFAVSGFLTSSYHIYFKEYPSFNLLGTGKALTAFPFLMFAAPFIIIRNTIRGRRIESRRMEFVAAATILSGIWALMSGTVVLALLHTMGL